MDRYDTRRCALETFSVAPAAYRVEQACHRSRQARPTQTSHARIPATRAWVLGRIERLDHARHRAADLDLASIATTP